MGNDRKTLGQFLMAGEDCSGLFFASSVPINGQGRNHYCYDSSSDPRMEEHKNRLKVFPKPGEYGKPVGLNLDQHLNDPQVEESEIRDY